MAEGALVEAVRSMSRRALAAADADDAACCVCFCNMREVRSAALVPCGHVLCSLCQSRVDACPLCRRRVERVVALGCVAGSPARFRTFWEDRPPCCPPLRAASRR